MQGCNDKVMDVFVTKNTQDDKDEFLGPVWSVELLESGTDAIVVNRTTDWVTWCMVPDADLEVGDLVRIGINSTVAYTGLCTVLQKVRLASIANACVGPGNVKDELIVLNQDLTNFTALPMPENTGMSSTGVGTAGTSASLENYNWYAYRLNYAFNLTLIASTPFEIQHITNEANFYKALISRRHTFRHNHGAVQTEKEKMYYPMYKIPRWLDSSGEMKVELDYGVRKVNWIKLVGYSLFHKRQVGFQSAHEYSDDDWVALFIPGVHGEVVSNNPVTHGCYAVLHVGGQKDVQSGALEYHTHEPDGVFKLNITGQRAPLRELRLRFIDRNGGPAQFGRIHLWFKVCVNHG